MSTTTTERQVVNLRNLYADERGLLTEIDAAIKRGAQFLDQWRADWFTLIDTIGIYMWSPHRCVLGQFCIASGLTYWAALQQFAVPYVAERWEPRSDTDWAMAGVPTDLHEAAMAASVLGFDGPRIDYPIMTQLWIGQIMRRRIEAGG